MLSAMQTFVTRFASQDLRIRAATNAGVLQLRFRMTTKNKQRQNDSEVIAVAIFGQLLNFRRYSEFASGSHGAN